jgi:uncharacterized protein
MSKEKIIKKTITFVKRELGQESTGHDWWHTWRVVKLAEKISKIEGGDIFIIKMAALLHDLNDWKTADGKKYGTLPIRNWLINIKVEKKIIDNICEIIELISFKGIAIEKKLKKIEAMIVQDADRLDALGAIGLARLFATGAARKRIIYNPAIKTCLLVKDFNKRDSYSDIHHIYDKILFLKDRLNTSTAKKIARTRHKFILLFLKEFFREWDLKI